MIKNYFYIILTKELLRKDNILIFRQGTYYVNYNYNLLFFETSYYVEKMLEINLENKVNGQHAGLKIQSRPTWILEIIPSGAHKWEVSACLRSLTVDVM